MSSHLIMVPESRKHPAGNFISTLPVVVVPSVYVPSAFAVKVPVTLSDPAAVTGLQLEISSPAAPMSRALALNLRHDDVTFQVPTTLPPHAVTLAQPPVVPPVPAPEVPPAPGVPTVPALQATEIIANPKAKTEIAD